VVKLRNIKSCKYDLISNAQLARVSMTMSNTGRWKQRVKQLKTETYAIYLASKDPRVPWYAKALILFVVAHTFSPIDLIPDFIPVIGYLDDLIIAPLGIMIALKLIPGDVLAACRAEAQEIIAQDRPAKWWTAAVIITIWLLAAVLLAIIVIRIFVKMTGGDWKIGFAVFQIPLTWA
jgi:uncharacterized membrane protein YkvA (DUF1232 family)